MTYSDLNAIALSAALAELEQVAELRRSRDLSVGCQMLDDLAAALSGDLSN
jgi:hypothetical protein